MEPLLLAASQHTCNRDPYPVRRTNLGGFRGTKQAICEAQFGDSPNPRSKAPATCGSTSLCSVPLRSRRARSGSQFSAEPCEGELRFVTGGQGREELIDAVRGEIRKDRGRGVSVSVCRRRGGLSVRLCCGSIRGRMGVVRARGRVPVCGRRPSYMSGA